MLVKMPTSDKVKKVACGGQFSLILTESGNIWAFGSPAYGQLGQNDDGQRIVSAGRVELDYKSSPVQIGGILKNKKIIDIACGDNHSLALDSDGAIYSWGRGDDGRLGHRDQVNQLVPKLVEELATDSRNVGVKSIACGEGISLAVSGMGQIFIWGKYRKTDANMYPKPIFDLMGWTIRSFAAGKVGIMISAEYHPSNKSLPSELEVISWGQGIVHGELCRGEGNPKNCAQLAEVQAFKGLDVELIVCGLGHTVFLLPDTDKNIKALSEEKFADWLPLDQTGDLEATNLNSNPGASSSKQLKKVGKRGAEEPTNAGKKKTRKSPT
ncbi:regulator of chromosome condensation 1/beta-lactamase-inhibitor protein II [Paraphysoderma sedebokerense]|nr:regulator of chromosome condensation 1/beta-lactamase-inhibitor protein II [Paraphysoderma sedebokerense]